MRGSGDEETGVARGPATLTADGKCGSSGDRSSAIRRLRIEGGAAGAAGATVGMESGAPPPAVSAGTTSAALSLEVDVSAVAACSSGAAENPASCEGGRCGMSALFAGSSPAMANDSFAAAAGSFTAGGGSAIDALAGAGAPFRAGVEKARGMRGAVDGPAAAIDGFTGDSGSVRAVVVFPADVWAADGGGAWKARGCGRGIALPNGGDDADGFAGATAGASASVSGAVGRGRAAGGGGWKGSGAGFDCAVPSGDVEA
jgi:hypothetical protein